MIVVDYKAGQLANRLFHFSYFIAHALEHNYTLVNPCFEEYKDFFDIPFTDDLKSKIWFNISANKKIDAGIKKIINQFRKLAKRNNNRFYPFEFHDIRRDFDSVYKEFDMSEHNFIKKARKKMLFVKGWNYRDGAALKKHTETLRRIFTPKEIYNKEVKGILNSTQDYDVCIGVHIRKGDYRDFFEGRWYYDDNVYASKLHALQNIFAKQGKGCVFLLCSNEVVKPSSFPGLNIISAERSAIVDLYTLAGCNYLIGPPSTFSMWASFYGNVPLLVLKNKEIAPHLENFKVAQGIESFF